MWFTRISINNPVMATMMMAAIVVLGLFAYNRLPIDQFPELNFPVVVISTEYPGASPEVVETEVSRVLEEAVNTVSGLKTLSSRSYEGTSILIAEFDLLVNSAQAAQDVREKIALIKPVLRDEVKEPVITRFNPDDFPVASILIEPNPDAAQPPNLRQLTLLAEQVVKKRLENIRGVGAANLQGGSKRQLRIEIQPNKLELYNVSMNQVLNALAQDNQLLPLGAIKTNYRESVVQLDARLKSLEDFRNLVVTNNQGKQVLLGELALIRDGEAELKSLALYQGQRVLSIDVLKSQDANSVDVVDRVRKSLKDIETELQGQVRLSLARDLSQPIRNSLQDVRKTLIEGALLTVVIVFLFLGSWRSTVITGLTLPVSLIGTFSVLYAAGFTINTLTLLAMSICVGLLIDDAIVVRENIVRHLQTGKPHRQAALEGTQEIGLAVLATTFSIVAVFLPVGFMGGIIGQFFHQFGITVACAVLLSMFVSFTLDPMLSSVWHDPQAHGIQSKSLGGRLLGGFQTLMTRLEQAYVRLLRWGLSKPKTVLALALLSFVASFGLLKWVGVEMTPPVDNSELGIQYYTPEGSPLELTERKAAQVEAVVRQHPEVMYVYTAINTGITAGKNYASAYVKLTPRSERKQSVSQLAAVLRLELAQIAGITVTQVGAQQSVGSGKPIQVSLLGPDLEMLKTLSEQVKTRMQTDSRLVDFDSSLKATKPTVRVELNRQALSDRGLTVQQIDSAIRPLLAGRTVGTWTAPDQDNYDVVVQVPENARQQIQQLGNLPLTVQTPNGPVQVKLAEVATLEPARAAAQINRKYLTREVLLSANVQGAAAGTVGNELKQALASIDLPPGYRISYGGSSKDMDDTLSFAIQALVLAVVFIYLILASQFGSFIQPLVIMMSLPLSLIGVILALLIFGSTLNIFSIIGFVMLMGLVTKNAILLVDFANQAIKRGATARDALLQAAETRLRPILMTTLAMVFGMLPLAIARGEGSEQRSPMAHAVIGGVITSTLLTLIVVPVLISLIENYKAKKKSKQIKQDPAPFDKIAS